MLTHRFARAGVRFASVVALLSLPLQARANGRPAATSTVTVDPDRASHLLIGATFGALISDDTGASWRLVCEQPLGTSGAVIDPVYLFVHTTGTLLAASVKGIIYSRNGGCDF